MQRQNKREPGRWRKTSSLLSGRSGLAATRGPMGIFVPGLPMCSFREAGPAPVEACVSRSSPRRRVRGGADRRVPGRGSVPGASWARRTGLCPGHSDCIFRKQSRATLGPGLRETQETDCCVPCASVSAGEFRGLIAAPPDSCSSSLGLRQVLPPTSGHSDGAWRTCSRRKPRAGGARHFAGQPAAHPLGLPTCLGVWMASV